MSRGIKVFLAVAGTLILLLAGWFFVISPQLEERDRLALELIEEEGELEKEELRLIELDNLSHEEIAGAEELFEKLSLEIPKKLEESILFSDINTAHEESGVILDQLSIDSDSRESVSDGEAFMVTLSGSGSLDNFKSFVNALQSMPRLFVVDYISLDSLSEGGYSFIVEGDVFVRNSSE